jgi:putative sigma-54 modulation protein
MGKNGYGQGNSVMGSGVDAPKARATGEQIDALNALSIQTRDCEVTPELRAHIEEKMRHIERFWPRMDEAILFLDCVRGQYSVELTLISGGLVARAQIRTDDLRASFDTVIHKIEAQLRRHKDRTLSRERKHDNRDGDIGLRNPRETILAPNGLSSNGTAPQTDAEADNDDSMVRVKRFALKPMSPEEAALQMDLLGHEFFVFRDADNGQTSVVYKRKSGGYGLIEPIAD